MRPYTRYRYSESKQPLPKSKLPKLISNLLIVLVIALFVVLSLLNLSKNHAIAASQQLKSGISGLCLNEQKTKPLSNSRIDLEGCNESESQDWVALNGEIKDSVKDCLQAKGDQSGYKLTISSCDGSSGQVWLRDRGGFENPDSSLCLSGALAKQGSSVNLGQCSLLYKPFEQWTPIKSNNSSYNPYSCNNVNKGQKVACYAEQEWTLWQSGTRNHNDLLDIYTDGNGYEEWCADFVSFVYKEAGYPFTQGERQGWDEYDANNIQANGFTVHDESSYVPKPGDIAYFNYSGGHVEIVVSGGQTPTFVYGDSATIDNTTGNGDMEANTVTAKADLGNLVYYLTPQ